MIAKRNGSIKINMSAVVPAFVIRGQAGIARKNIVRKTMSKSRRNAEEQVYSLPTLIKTIISTISFHKHLTFHKPLEHTR
jgi:hypothetical protein